MLGLIIITALAFGRALAEGHMVSSAPIVGPAGGIAVPPGTRSEGSAAGQATVNIDAATGQICVTATNQAGGGSAYGLLAAPEPWYFITGGTAAGPASLVIVDGQRRLGSVEATVAGQAVHGASTDGGLTISLQVAAPPTKLIMLDAAGGVLTTQRPLAEVTAGQSPASSATDEP